ncbi:MAG: ANTAR domain-containing protein [Treponema sp.]|nr:ANTAR domain-containing protein [Spirochaetia bacterium]MDY2839284.1 ANTAR domain-containing protein [Treponema sp.]MDY5123989.1 ANTAR domain-containing protein [Treponema sp.]
MTIDSHSVLVVTKDIKISTLINAMLMPPMFDLQIVSGFNEARRKCAEKIYNIIIVDFADGEGTDFATDIADSLSTILLLCPNQYYEQISYKVESFGILTVPSPFDQFFFYNMIKIAIAVQYKVTVLSSQTLKLKEKMEEIRLVNRAKMLLMQNLNMSEEEAHHYLEKEAMDRCLKRIKVAEQIISTYGS